MGQHQGAVLPSRNVEAKAPDIGSISLFWGAKVKRWAHFFLPQHVPFIRR